MDDCATPARVLKHLWPVFSCARPNPPSCFRWHFLKILLGKWMYVMYPAWTCVSRAVESRSHNRGGACHGSGGPRAVASCVSGRLTSRVGSRTPLPQPPHGGVGWGGRCSWPARAIIHMPPLAARRPCRGDTWCRAKRAGVVGWCEVAAGCLQGPRQRRVAVQALAATQRSRGGRMYCGVVVAGVGQGVMGEGSGLRAQGSGRPRWMMGRCWARS